MEGTEKLKIEHTTSKWIIESYTYIPPSTVQQYVLDMQNDDPIMKKEMVAVVTKIEKWLLMFKRVNLKCWIIIPL